MKIVFKIVLHLLLFTAAIILMPHFIPGIEVSGYYAAFISAVIISLLNVTIKPIIKLVTLPINIITLGLFGLVINAVVVWFVASFVEGFSIATFMGAFFAGLVLAAVNWILHHI